MSSQSEEIVVKKNKISKMCLDSQNQQEQQEERRRRKQQKMRRKKERRQRREREQMQRQQQQQQSVQQQSESNYNILLAQDSNSRTSFSKVRQEIKRRYPQFRDHYTIEKTVEKKVKKQQKTERREKSPKREEIVKPARISQSKVEQKQDLVFQFGKRWWYALPEWPPKDYNYEQALRKQKYRLVSQQSFKKETDVVDGLTKVFELQGYRGIFKSKNKLIDMRPKQNCPSIQNFKKLDSSQLVRLIRIAIQNQINALSKVEFKQNGDEQLLAELKKQILRYKN